MSDEELWSEIDELLSPPKPPPDAKTIQMIMKDHPEHSETHVRRVLDKQIEDGKLDFVVYKLRKWYFPKKEE